MIDTWTWRRTSGVLVGFFLVGLGVRRARQSVPETEGMCKRAPVEALGAGYVIGFRLITSTLPTLQYAMHKLPCMCLERQWQFLRRLWAWATSPTSAGMFSLMRPRQPPQPNISPGCPQSAASHRVAGIPTCLHACLKGLARI